MKKESGITLIALVVTIIVLLILSSFAVYTGHDAIENTKYTKFVAELKIMQTYVNSWYEELNTNSSQLETNINKKFTEIGAKNASLDTQAQVALSAIKDDSDYSDYYILDEEEKETLGVEGVSQIVLVNVKKRKVVSYYGLNYNGDMYYTLDGSDEIYNVEYKEQTGVPTFNVKSEYVNQGKARITVYGIDYTGDDKYNDKWKVKYRIGQGEWETSNNLSFIVAEDGDYSIKVVSKNEDISSQESKIIVPLFKKKNSTLVGDTTLSKMSSTNPVIPQGFRAVDTDDAKWKYTDNNQTEVEGWNDGLVIEDDIGNQFVWVPCTTGTSGDVVTYSKDFSYPSSYSASSSNTLDANDSTNETLDGDTYRYKAIPVVENTQVTTYGGFYVARFEAGIPTTTMTHSAEENNVYDYVPISKKGSKVWNFIDYTHCYVAAEKMIKNSEKYGNNKSGLITGTQWDTIMKWYEKNNIKVGGTQVAGTQDWGTYRNFPYDIAGLYFTWSGSTTSNWINDSISNVINKDPNIYHASGLNNNGYKKNIADLGGNLWEKTAEYPLDNNKQIISRGGCSNWTTTGRQASSRSNGAKGIDWSFYLSGFRVVLYVQD